MALNCHGKMFEYKLMLRKIKLTKVSGINSNEEKPEVVKQSTIYHDRWRREDEPSSRADINGLVNLRGRGKEEIWH
jgi:hypothetical protein